MSDELVHIDRKNNEVAVVSMMRPDKRNALSVALLQQLGDTIERLEQESECRVLILRGEGPVFCAGLDLIEASDPRITEKSADGVRRVVTLLHESPIVSIAAATGAAYAGGAGLLAACDLVVAAADFQLGFPEVRRGLVAAIVWGVLSRKVRDGDLRQLFLVGEPINASRAQMIGLVQYIESSPRVLDKALSVAVSIMAGGPNAVRESKLLLNHDRASVDFKHLQELHERVRHSAEAHEGLAAFKEKAATELVQQSLRRNTLMATTPTTSSDSQRERQIKQAEEILSTLPQRAGVAKGLFRGQFVADWVFPYPQLTADELARSTQSLKELREFCDANLDPVQIDRDADIPRHVIDGLAHLGVLGMTAPTSLGGRGFSQLGYCRFLEELGGRCSSTSIFVNAHHSIGMRALLLFGSAEQQQRWLPDLISGRKLAAFALTEPEAGSDAANVQTTATPTADGTGFVINGQKRYISNAAIADVLTVMARTPNPTGSGTSVTAFLVSPDLPGFKIVEPRMSKLGIRGTATGRLEFQNMTVPRENVLGPIGKGLRVALTVLDFGRTTFGACCTGAAKTALRLAVEHAKTRRQFDRRLADFELVQQKLARMAAWTYAIEAMTSVTAGMIDRGLEDYMLETAMLKVYSTERLWTIVNDSFQIHGGAAYFTDRPLERMLRDARINQIGEGANEVLLSFMALAGMRQPGLGLKETWDQLHRPADAAGALYRFAGETLRLRLTSPHVPVNSSLLQQAARRIGALISRLGYVVRKTLIKHRESVVEKQIEQERIAWAAMEIFASLCVLSRRDAQIGGRIPDDPAHDATARLFLDESAANAARRLSMVGRSPDQHILDAARSLLGATK